MVDEILFRGKIEGTNEWVYGFYQKHSRDIDTNICYIYDGAGVHFHVIPSTLGQYTGLTDRNGVRIFEGDIIDYKNPDGIDTYIVTWDNEYSRFAAAAIWFGETKIISDFVFYSPSKCTVIGNIHDNPELLIEQKNKEDEFKTRWLEFMKSFGYQCKSENNAKPKEMNSNLNSDSDKKEIQYSDIYEMFDNIIAWLEKFHLGDDCYFVVGKSGASMYRQESPTVLPKDYRDKCH